MVGKTNVELKMPKKTNSFRREKWNNEKKHQTYKQKLRLFYSFIGTFASKRLTKEIKRCGCFKLQSFKRNNGC